MHSADFALLAPELRLETLETGTVLSRPQEDIGFVHFVEQGMLSIVSPFDAGREVEVSVIGREGMAEMPLILGDRQTTYLTTVQIAGTVLRMRAEPFHRAVRASRRLHDFLLLYARAIDIQTASTASANGRAKLDERLARWLLMTHDRIEGDRLDITHELLSKMLACRRPGVTVALHVLEGEGLIRSNRGQIVILDRDGLERAANGSYGLAEREYARLFGVDFRSRIGGQGRPHLSVVSSDP